jgi:hypothetical protein
VPGGLGPVTRDRAEIRLMGEARTGSGPRYPGPASPRRAAFPPAELSSFPLNTYTSGLAWIVPESDTVYTR